MASFFNQTQRNQIITSAAYKKYSLSLQWNKLKQAVFFLFHESLNTSTKSSWNIFILSTFECLQCLSYSFIFAFNHTWVIHNSDSIHNYLNKFFKLFLLTPYLIESSYYMFLVAYFGSVLFTLMVLCLFIYLLYLIYNNTILSKWHLVFFNLIARCYPGIFFIPIFKAIIPLFSCGKFIKEHSVIFNKDNAYCASIEAIVYTILSSLTLPISVFFSFLFSGLYYDIRMTKANYLSRLSPRYDMWMALSKLIVSFAFEYADLRSQTSKIIMAFLLMMVSLWLYFILKLHILFYSMFTQKVYEGMILVLLVTNSLLFIDVAMQYFGFDSFDGFVELWCFSVVFVILYQVFSGKKYARELPVELENTATPNQAIKAAMGLMTIIQERDSNIEYEMILNGYIINHKAKCNNDQCHLKFYERRNHHLEYSIQGQNVLYQHLNDLFVDYLGLFPFDIHLRIIYSLFALEVLGKINICRMNMFTASNSNPSIQQQFCLYRMNKIIEDGYVNIEDDSVNLNVASTIIFDQYFQRFQETIKTLGVKYLEFWNAFVQEDTNMKKIKVIGNTILNLIHLVFDLWEKLQEINANDYDCLRLYGQFQIDILNDKQLGELYISQSKEIILTSGRQIKLFKNDLNHLCFDGSPVLIASQVLNEGLVISQVTSSFCHLFQFQRIELIGKDISVLMPNEIREYHAKAVGVFLKKNQLKKAIEKRKLKGMALNKTGFIFPIKFTMIFLPNLTKEANIAIRIKQNKQLATYTCHVMINPSLDITNISTQAIKFFNITEKGIWSIKNLKKIKAENRISIKYLIKEINAIYSSQLHFNKHSQFKETTSHNNLTSILNLGWKEHRLIKNYSDEKNALVHLYDFQQVYHVSYNDHHNTRDPYLTTVLASQIDKNISLWNMSINDEYKGLNKSGTNYITAHMNIFDISFNQIAIEYYVIALDYVYQETNERGKLTRLHSFKTLSTFNLKMTGFLSKMTNLSECKFKKNKVVKYDVNNGVFAIKVIKKGKTSTLVSILSPTNKKNGNYNIPFNNENENIDSKPQLSSSFGEDKNKDSFQSSEDTHNFKPSKKQHNLRQGLSRNHQLKFDIGLTNSKGDDNCLNENEGEGDVYNSLFFQDYSENVLYYDLDPNTLTCSIFSKPTPKDGKSLAELTHFFENDTLKTDDDISNIKNTEGNDFQKAKYDINKNYILKNKVYKKNNETMKQMVLSLIIFIIHISLSICSLIFYNSYLIKTKNNILSMNRIAALLNYTLMSTSYFINTMIYPFIPSLTINDRISLYYNVSYKLLWNSRKMYETLAITDLFLTDTFNEINSTHSMNITMLVLINFDQDNNPLTSSHILPFNEAVNYLIAAIASLGSDNNINSSYFHSDAFFLCFNCINNYYLKTMDYLMRIKAIVIETREPNKNQLAIIYASIALNIVLLFMLYLWISFIMRKMNNIVLEFLSIKQVEAQFIAKKIERFIRNIRINDLEADEEEKEGDLEVINKKRNYKNIADKMKQIQSKEIGVIVIFVIVFLLLIFDFIIQYIFINKYDNDSNQLVELYYTLNEFNGNINLLAIGTQLRLLANRDITMLNEPIDIMINKQFDLFVVLKERLVYNIQMNGLYSSNFTKVYNNEIALDKLQFDPGFAKLPFDSLRDLSFDYTLAYYYNTLLGFYSASLNVRTKEEALADLRILFSNGIKDYVLGPYLAMISNASIIDCVSHFESMILFLFIWFWLWIILLSVIFFLIWIPLLSRLEREVTNTKCLILLVPTSILMKKKSFLEILKNENMINIRK